MASPQQVPHVGGLGTQLRALRREFPTLVVLTEIIQLDERRVTFRATIHINGEVRAQGHAALGADPAGQFVAAAEQLAVEQALLLGGFGSAGEETATPDNRAVSPTTAYPLDLALSTRTITPSKDGADHPVARRRRRPDQQPVTQPNAEVPAGNQTALAPEVLGADDTRAPAPSPEQLPTADDAIAIDSPQIVSTWPPEADTSEWTEVQKAPSSAPLRRRDRSAERERARSRQSAVEPGANAETGNGQVNQLDLNDLAAANELAAAVKEQQPAIEQPPTRTGGRPSETSQPPPGSSHAVELEPDEPGLPTPAPTRRVRARAASNKQAAPAPPEEKANLEAIRADWRAGRPIPAWWPPERIAVEKPLSRPQAERLRMVALGEEITAAQLDSYSTMLFGSVVAKLSQAQGAILEERLNPAYPSPLQELSARRVLHPIAVGDSFPIPDGQSSFIRWHDVPPAEETPPTPSWRAGGAKKSRTRRR